MWTKSTEGILKFRKYCRVAEHFNIPLASVVDISHSTILLELALNLSI